MDQIIPVVLGALVAEGSSDTVPYTLGGWELMEGVSEFTRVSSFHGKLIEKLLFRSLL